MTKGRFLGKGELIALIVFAVGVLVWFLWPKATGGSVAVTRSGVPLQTYALSVPGRYPTTGVNGFHFTLVIDQEKVWVEESTCPDLVCQRHAPIRGKGESIICLPGELVVTVTGTKEGIDGVSG